LTDERTNIQYNLNYTPTTLGVKKLNKNDIWGYVNKKKVEYHCSGDIAMIPYSESVSVIKQNTVKALKGRGDKTTHISAGLASLAPFRAGKTSATLSPPVFRQI
jgi:hypothetical protein